MARGEELHFVQKRFLVQRLACFDTPTQAAAAFKEEYGIELQRNRVSFYDPTTKGGQALSEELKVHFHETRKKFLSSLDEIPIANPAVRLRRLDRMAAAAEARGNIVLAATLGEMAAKEIGGAYTNLRKLAGHDGGAIKTENQTAVTVTPGQVIDELTGIFGAAAGSAPAVTAAAPDAASEQPAGGDPVLHTGADGGGTAEPGASPTSEALAGEE